MQQSVASWKWRLVLKTIIDIFYDWQPVWQWDTGSSTIFALWAPIFAWFISTHGAYASQTARKWPDKPKKVVGCAVELYGGLYQLGPRCGGGMKTPFKLISLIKDKNDCYDHCHKQIRNHSLSVVSAKQLHHNVISQVCKCYVINSKSAMLWAFRRAMDVSW